MYNPSFTPNYYPNLQNPFYNPQMPIVQPQIQQTQEQNMNDNGIIWVQGEAAAKAYPVLKNNTVVLWDSESQTIYIKSVDNSGIPTTRILEWTERVAQKNTQEVLPVINNTNNVDFVTRQEFDEIVKKINSISNKIGNNKQQKVNNNINNVNNKEGNNNG